MLVFCGTQVVENMTIPPEILTGVKGQHISWMISISISAADYRRD